MSCDHQLPRALVSRGVEVCFAPGAVLFGEGSEASGLYVVTKGHVRVLRGRGGRAHVIHEEGPGGTLGEVPLFEGGRYPATAIAAVRTTCIRIEREDVLAAIAADPDVAVAMLARLAVRVRTLVNQLDSRTALNTRARLATWILARDAAARNEAREFTLGGTHHEIAEALGTVRETVARGIRSLADDGFIGSLGRGRYVVRDRPALLDVAGTAPHHIERARTTERRGANDARTP